MRTRTSVAAHPGAPEPLLVDVREAARLLGVGICTVQTLCMRDQLRSVKLGKIRRIVRSDLERFIAENTSAHVG